MATYYIDPSWGGPFNGTLAEPYSLFSSVPFLNAGDSVLFKRGTTYSGNISYNTTEGTSTTLATPVTFGAYGTGELPNIRSSSSVFNLSGINGIVIENLNIGSPTSFATSGVFALNVAELRVSGCTFLSNCDYAIRVDNTGSTKLENYTITNNTILGTWSNSGILFIWGTSVGGVFQNITISSNSITNTGAFSNTGNPMGIRFICRQTAFTSGGGVTDLDLFCYGVSVTNNNVFSTRGYGINVVGAKSGSTETVKNRIANNTLTFCGDGTVDAHMLWLGASRNVVIEDNVCDTSYMFAGSATGTGVGIFVDTPGDLFSGCTDVVVRRNVIRNTGMFSGNSLNSSEVAGAGILVLVSQRVTIQNNTVSNCNNGIGVIGYGGVGLPSDTVNILGNTITNATDTAVVVYGAANAVSVTNNYINTRNNGIYVENIGAYACTNYVETGNTVYSSRGFFGGDSPTNSTPTITNRTPTTSNKTISSPIKPNMTLR